MSVAGFWYWEETEDAECEGVEACGWMRCQGCEENSEAAGSLTGGDPSGVTEGGPTT